MSFPKKTNNPNPSPIGNKFGLFLFGPSGENRTHGLLNPIQARYQNCATPGYRPLPPYRSIGDKRYYTHLSGFCQHFSASFSDFENSITKFNKFSHDFLCILAQHKQAVKFPSLQPISFVQFYQCFLLALPFQLCAHSLILWLLFVTPLAPVLASIGGTLSLRSYIREFSGDSC